MCPMKKRRRLCVKKELARKKQFRHRVGESNEREPTRGWEGENSQEWGNGGTREVVREREGVKNMSVGQRKREKGVCVRIKSVSD